MTKSSRARTATPPLVSTMPFVGLPEVPIDVELLAAGRRLEVADELGRALAALSLRGFVAPEATFTAPWAVSFPPGPVGCHVVTAGRARLLVGTAEPVVLAAGDAVLLPHGNAHVLASTTGAVAARPVMELIDAGRFVAREGLVHGGGGAESRLLTSCFGPVGPAVCRAFAPLPPVVCVRGLDDTWLRSFSALVAAEGSSSAPATSELLHHLGRTLLARLLRAWRQQAADGNVPAVGNGGVQRALTAMAQDLARPWSVRGLAQLAGMSRSRFVARFTEVVGTAPARHLFAQRMARAAALLLGDEPIKVIADRCGYATEAAFTHAFRRWAGEPPGAFRQRARSDSAPFTPRGRR